MKLTPDASDRAPVEVHGDTVQQPLSFYELLKLGLDIAGLEVAILSRIEGRQYTIVDFLGDGFGLECNQVLELKDTFCYMVASSKEPYVIGDVSVDERFSCRAAYRQMHLKSYIAAPIFVRGQFYGTINFSGRHQIQYDKPEKLMSLICMVAANAGKLIEEHQARQDIERLEATSMDLQFAANIGLWKIDLPTGRFYSSSGHRRLFGLADSAKEAKIEPMIRSCLSDQDNLALNHEIQKAVESKSSFTFQHAFRPWGTEDWRYAETQGRCEIDDHGVVQSIYGTCQDITEKHILAREQALFQENARLAAIGEMAAGVGHEINNPLAIAIGFVNKIKKRLEAADRSDLRSVEDLCRVSDALERIGSIVTSLRKLSHRTNTEESVFDVMLTLQDTVDFTREIMAKTGVQIFLTSQAESSAVSRPFIRGTKTEVQQIFMNLLVNARDAVEHRDCKEIHIAVDWDDRVVRLAFRDSGCGMDAETANRIFDPFFTTKGTEQGSGIGLSVVYKFVKNLKGDIQVISSPNEGATFTVEFPVTEPENVVALAPQPESRHKMPSLRVLLVEDEPDLLCLGKEILEEIGINVTCATDGQAALEKLKESVGFDLVVSDHLMPKMTGMELLGNMRQDLNPCPKFILVTGGIIPRSMFQTKEMAPDDFLTKPFEVEDLERSILDLFPATQKKAG